MKTAAATLEKLHHSKYLNAKPQHEGKAEESYCLFLPADDRCERLRAFIFYVFFHQANVCIVTVSVKFN